jgi:AAA domain
VTILSSYWPTQDQINRCIKTEAETASDAVLLAVHQETPLYVRNAGSHTKRSVKERDMLEDFLTQDLPEGTLLLAITGASGAGKSHMIRWLAAQLERDPRAKDMHVIRIPKSANLKTVVENILEPLREKERFEEARRELENAVSAVNPQDGAIRFAAELELALKEKAKNLLDTLRENPNGPDSRNLKTKLDHARKLPGYFSDTALKNHFKEKILTKIVERAVLGRAQDDLDEEMLPQFSVDDLEIPESVRLGDASREVQTYYKTVLNRSGGKGYQQAVDVLNSVVDAAIRNVFRLNQAMGGVTLEEIVLQIRELLMEEGKELVLLIEDFAALSGIQEVLLSVCIQEAVRDGKLIRAPMRTALAVTDGYLASRDTILTRAKREWVVESVLADETEIVSRTTNLVGAYLNAARWGEANLETKFHQSKDDPSIGLTKWIDVYKAELESVEEADTRKIFGQDDNKVPLFPFNREAIRLLIDDHLKEGGELQYRPRWIINYIIRDTLKLKNAYEQDAFPPPDFSSRKTRADIANWLSQSRISDLDKGRLGQAIVYWGGNPDSREKLGNLSPNLFKAFKLPAPTELGIEPLEPKSEAGNAPGTEPRAETEIKEPIEDPFITDWDARLERWVHGERLTQQSANQIRVAIVSALNKAIDWVALCMKPVPVKNAHIELPNALGNPQTDRKIVIAEDATDKDATLRKTLLAFLRYEHQDQTWNYKEADEDTARIANAIDQLIPCYLKIVFAKTAEDTETLTTALARQGQLLGIAPKRISGRQSISDAVFTSSPELGNVPFEPDSPQDKWHQLRISASAVRGGLQELLTAKLGAFQGNTGHTLFAIDVARLKVSGVESFTNLDGLDSNQREHLSSLGLVRLRTRSNALIKGLSGSSERLQKLIGTDFDKHRSSNALKELVQSAEAGRVWPSNFPLSKQAFLNRIEQFRDAPVMELQKQLSALADGAQSGEIDAVLHALGNLDFQLINETDKFLISLHSFLGELEKEVTHEEENLPGTSIQSLVGEIKTDLGGIKETLVRLGEKELVS